MSISAHSCKQVVHWGLIDNAHSMCFAAFVKSCFLHNSLPLFFSGRTCLTRSLINKKTPRIYCIPCVILCPPCRTNHSLFLKNLLNDIMKTCGKGEWEWERQDRPTKISAWHEFCTSPCTLVFFSTYFLLIDDQGIQVLDFLSILDLLQFPNHFVCITKSKSFLPRRRGYIRASVGILHESV